jgi:alkylation response protein AidB-like acyl-CoA dehydrogenase
VVLPEPATAIETIDGTDPTRRSARVSFRDAPAHRIAANCAGALRRMMTVARALLAAEQIGVADRCLDMAVEYAGIRTQFGRPIGSFQAIKHLCADTLVEVECARALTADALLGVVAEDPDAEVRSAMAAASSSEACVQSAERGIQVHGAIGYTWEHDCHLYLRRAITSAQLLGAAQDNYGLVATDLLLSAG